MALSLLFVDDQAALLAAMREFFMMRGFAVDCASDVEEARALIDRRDYALAICDVTLKGMHDADGLQVVAHIRRASPATKIVILSGGSLTSIRERSQEWQVDALLQKPLPLPTLAAVVEQLLAAV